MTVFFCSLVVLTLLRTPLVSAQADPLVKRMLFENWRFSPSLYAEKADMYMCHVEKASKIQQIHQIRPDLICLIYRNVRSVKGGSSEFKTALNNNWILKDANGVLIYYPEFNEYIVDKGSPSYQQWVANLIKTNLDKYGANGVFADCTLYPTIGEHCWGTNWKSGEAGPPINPRTGQLYTNDEQKKAEIALINKIKDTIAPKLVIGNGIFTGERFFQRDYDDILLGSKIDGAMSEAWLSTRGSSEWYSEDKWLNSIKFVVWLENNFLKEGKMFLPVSENAETNDESKAVLPSGCTKEQYVTYCFSSLMLGATSSSHYLNLGYYMPEDYPQSLFEIDFGNPQNSYYLVQGTHVYTRGFSKVKVLVNPTYQSYQVSLDGKYETLNGQPVTSPITVKPHTGMILKKLEAPPPPPSEVYFTSGFEAGNFGEWDGTYVTSGETASVVQTLPHDDVYHARFTTDGSASIARAYCYKNLAGSSELYTLAYVRFDGDLPSLSSWNALWLIQFRDASGSVIASYGVKADRASTKWACMYGSQNAYASSGPQPNTWYAVEAYFKKATSGKTLAIYVDGQEVASLSLNTIEANEVAQVRVGIAYNAPRYKFSIYIDTVTVYNEDSNSQIYTSDFETGNFDEWDGTYVTRGETASVVRTLPHVGVYHAKFTTDGAVAIARTYCHKNIAGATELYTLAYVRFDSVLPSLDSWNALWLIQFRDASGSVIASYGVKADRASTKWACMYGSQNAYASSGPQPNTWYAVEAYFRKAASGETLAIYVDGQKVASLAVNTSGANNVAQVRIGIAYNDPDYAINLYTDTITIDDQYIQTTN